jgi:hypothetical protein
MTSAFRLDRVVPESVKQRARQAYLDGQALEDIRARSGMSWKQLKALVADLPKRERTPKKRWYDRIARDL